MSINIESAHRQLDESAQSRLHDILTHGPRDFDEWLMKSEELTCAICKDADARECALRDLVEKHHVYSQWHYCVKCGGRTVARDANKNEVFGKSTPVMVTSHDGSSRPRRCDCFVADKTWAKTQIAPEPYLSQCQLQRFQTFQAAAANVKRIRCEKEKP